MNKILSKVVITFLMLFMITGITGCNLLEKENGFESKNIVLMYDFDVTNLNVQAKDDLYFIKYNKADKGFEYSLKYYPEKDQVFTEITADFSSDTGYVYVVIYQNGEAVSEKQMIDSNTSIDISNIQSSSSFQVCVINENAEGLKLSLTVI